MQAISSFNPARDACQDLEKYFEADEKSKATPNSDVDEILVLDEVVWKTVARSKEEQGFRLEAGSLIIPKGARVGICGSIGSGKSTLLQGLLGDLELVQGEVCV